MAQSSIYLPQNRVGLFEYVLVAFPDALVHEKVMAQKEVFTAQYKQKPSIKLKPHITIASFVAREAMEETIVRYTQRICFQTHSFDVAINNYSGYPPHSIFLRVQNQEPFRQLAKDLKVIGDYIDSCACPPMTLYSRPHLSIAKQLSEPVYQQAISDYSKKTFYETFKVNELVLLRRSSHYEVSKPVHVFRLQPGKSILTNHSH